LTYKYIYNPELANFINGPYEDEKAKFERALAMTAEQRKQWRKQWRDVVRLRKTHTQKATAAALGVSIARLLTIMSYPAISETKLRAYAREERRRNKDFAAQRAELDAKRREMDAESAHEIAANAMVCLIDALEEMRPYTDIGPQPTPVE
jgi:hypothetical protein